MATSSHACIQHQLSFDDFNNSIWTRFWSQAKIAIFTGSRHWEAPLQRIFCSWEITVVAATISETQGEKYKTNFDVKAAIHKFKIGQRVWLSETTSIGKNAKLSSNWIEPYEIVDINDNNAKLKIKNNKLKVVNIAWIKWFVEEATKRLSEDDSRSF